MRLAKIVSVAAVMAALAGPLAAQQVRPDYDQNATVTLEGTVDTIVWSMAQSHLMLKPANGGQLWDVELPNSTGLIANGITAEVLHSGVPVKVKAYKAKDAACSPNCKAQAVELTLGAPGKTYALSATRPAG